MTDQDFRFLKPFHAYLLGADRLWSVTERLVGLRIIDREHFTFSSRMRGMAAHIGAELIESGGLDWESVKATERALGVPVEPYIRGWERFLKETGWVSVKIERPNYHPLYRYAGTPDRVGFWPDKQEGIVDLKTGLPQAWWDLQLGGYDEMEPRLKPGTARRLTCVALTEKGDYTLKHVRDVNAGRTFLAMNAAHAWGLAHGAYQDERQPIAGPEVAAR